MPKDAMKKVIEHQVRLQLQDMGLCRRDLGDLEYTKYLYEMAVKMLVEL